MESDPIFNQKSQEKTSKNHQKSTKIMEFSPILNRKSQEKILKSFKNQEINKNHLQTGIWALQGRQVDQNGSKRGRK